MPSHTISIPYRAFPQAVGMPTRDQIGMPLREAKLNHEQLASLPWRSPFGRNRSACWPIRSLCSSSRPSGLARLSSTLPLTACIVAQRKLRPTRTEATGLQVLEVQHCKPRPIVCSLPSKETILSRQHSLYEDLSHCTTHSKHHCSSCRGYVSLGIGSSYLPPRLQSCSGSILPCSSNAPSASRR